MSQEKNVAANAVESGNKVANTKGRKFIKKEKAKGIPVTANNYPEHFVQVACIIKNNAEIRRFTSIGIINYLLQKGEIKGKSRYVSFMWNKFRVSCDGLVREYSYTESFFLNCLCASFASFASNASKVINNLVHKELHKDLGEVASQEDIDNIKQQNEQYVISGEKNNNPDYVKDCSDMTDDADDSQDNTETAE